MESVPERNYHPRTYSLDQFLERNRLPIKSPPRIVTELPELQDSIPPNSLLDLNPLFGKKYTIEDSVGDRTLEEGLMQAYLVNSQGITIAELNLAGSGDFDESRKEWYALTPIRVVRLDLQQRREYLA